MDNAGNNLGVASTTGVPKDGTKINIKYTIGITIIIGLLFALITKYGFKKGTGWVIGSTIVGLGIGFMTDNFIQTKLKG